MREKETVPKKGALPTFNWTSPGELYFGILNIVCGDKILWKYSDDPNWSQFHKQSLYSYNIFWDDSPSWDVLWVLWSQNWPNGNDNFTARRLGKVCGYFMRGVYLALILNNFFCRSMGSIAICDGSLILWKVLQFGSRDDRCVEANGKKYDVWQQRGRGGTERAESAVGGGGEAKCPVGLVHQPSNTLHYMHQLPD